ncbi:MAG: hypothetical protein WC054_14675 [Candidatus Nanopelagicales bacterium]
MSASVYRMWDASGDLLYVGASTSYAARIQQHQGQRAWFLDVSNITIEHFATHELAFEAEAAAIAAECPKYNRTFTTSKPGKKSALRFIDKIDIRTGGHGTACVEEMLDAGCSLAAVAHQLFVEFGDVVPVQAIERWVDKRDQDLAARRRNDRRIDSALERIAERAS